MRFPIFYDKICQKSSKFSSSFSKPKPIDDFQINSDLNFDSHDVDFDPFDCDVDIAIEI